MYRPTNAPIQRARIGVTIHHEMIHPIVSKSSVPVASPSPAIAPTVVIDVGTGTPKTFAMRIPSPMKRGRQRPPRA